MIEYYYSQVDALRTPMSRPMFDRPSGVTMGPHKLCAELSRRLATYTKVHALFGFLVDFPLKTDTDIREAAHRFRENYYPQDVELYIVCR